MLWGTVKKGGWGVLGEREKGLFTQAARKVSLRKEHLSKHQEEAKEAARSEGKDYFRQRP